MPIETVPGTELTYHLIAYNEDGNERTDDPDAPPDAVGRLSVGAARIITDEPITDVFLMSHGWRGDIPAARAQYQRWIGAMAACTDDIAQLRATRPGFRPLLVGLHWPSEPWGDEALGGDDGVSFDGAATSADALIDDAAARTADTPAARAALRVIFQSAIEDPSPPTLPPDVQAAYATLNRETGLGGDGPAGAPGDDREPFDAEAIYQSAQAEEVSFDGFHNAVLEPLRLLSFWQMKGRACVVGEHGIHGLLRALQTAAGDPAVRDVRFHLMGHSFGCIVVSAAVAGPAGSPPLPRTVSSLVLVQGALSLWSYCTDIPPAPGQRGHFRSIAESGKVAGPIVVTISMHDTAVGALYPKAAGVAGLFGDQVSFDPASLPKYGAPGTFGMRGPGLQIVDRDLAPVSEAYDFQAGTVYNLECSQIISEGGPPSGAHSDISRPEVAHAVWAAAGAGASGGGV
jgi:hypothetical protein